jgi:excisionase family DNA binding protein
MEKLLLRVVEAAELASVGRTTAYQLIAAGAWPVVRVGTAVRVPLAGLRAWVEAQTREVAVEEETG